MDFLKSLKKTILGILESNSGATNVYKAVDETRGKLSSNEVLEIIAPMIAEENLSLAKRQTSLISLPPALQEDEKTGNRHWLVTVLYERLNGNLLNENERIVNFWLTVQDESGEIGEKIYPH
ncbi:MAG: hypothetical protein LUM44_12090 [Pyrinomonadaceae bacterium]|nr:hypothetical protein [Pyrinomonadaceae bacterium]